MRKINLLCLLLSLSLFVLVGLADVGVAAEGQSGTASEQGGCQAVVSQLKKHDKKLSREMRQIKRQLAVLQQSIEEPDAQDIFSGIGYILGLFGVAAYMASRKGKK